MSIQVNYNKVEEHGNIKKMLRFKRALSTAGRQTMHIFVNDCQQAGTKYGLDD